MVERRAELWEVMEEGIITKQLQNLEMEEEKKTIETNMKQITKERKKQMIKHMKKGLL